MKKYKYSTKFNFEVSAASLDEYQNVSEASLKSLRDLIPDDVDLERNIDITAVAFNAAVVNKFNKNGDGIDSKSAITQQRLFYIRRRKRSVFSKFQFLSFANQFHMVVHICEIRGISQLCLGLGSEGGEGHIPK